MEGWRNLAEGLALVLETAGVLLLFREVWRGHRAEGHEADFAQLERIEQPMRHADWEEAYAESYIYRDPTPERLRDARKVAAALGPAACQQAVQAEWQGELAARLQSSRLRWIHWTAPTNLAKRKRLLWLGSGFVITALLLQAALLATRGRDAPPMDDSGVDNNGAPGGHGVEWRAALVSDATVIRFDPAEAALQYRLHGRVVDLTSTVCDVKRALADQGVGGVLVVGRYDQRELRKQVRLRWSSNHALAQARADSVANFLGESNDCGPALGTVVRIVGGPKYPGGSVTSEQLSIDRSVEVVGLVTQSVEKIDAPAEAGR